jgi:hypothetical protein
LVAIAICGSTPACISAGTVINEVLPVTMLTALVRKNTPAKITSTQRESSSSPPPNNAIFP